MCWFFWLRGTRYGSQKNQYFLKAFLKMSVFLMFFAMKFGIFRCLANEIDEKCEVRVLGPRTALYALLWYVVVKVYMVGNTLDIGNILVGNTLDIGNILVGNTLDIGNILVGNTLDIGNILVGNTSDHYPNFSTDERIFL